MEIEVVVVPNAKVPSIIKLSELDYKVKVNAKAIEGKANARLIEMLSNYFWVPKSRIRILRGLNGRRKSIGIDI